MQYFKSHLTALISNYLKSKDTFFHSISNSFQNNVKNSSHLLSDFFLQGTTLGNSRKSVILKITYKDKYYLHIKNKK